MVVVFTSTLDNTIKPLEFVREFIGIDGGLINMGVRGGCNLFHWIYSI